MNYLLKLGPSIQAGHDFYPLIGNAKGVFKLCRDVTVLSDSSPFIGKNFQVRFTQVDHWFDGEHHAFFYFQAFTKISIMQDLRFLVEIISDAMPTKLAHHLIAVAFSKLLDCCTNVTQSTPGLDTFDAFLQGFPTDLYQFFRLLTR